MKYAKLIKRVYINTDYVFKQVSLSLKKAKLLDYNYGNQISVYLNSALSLGLDSDALNAGDTFYSDKYIIQSFGKKFQYSVYITKQGYLLLRAPLSTIPAERMIHFGIRDGRLYTMILEKDYWRTTLKLTKLIRLSVNDMLQVNESVKGI